MTGNKTPPNKVSWGEIPKAPPDSPIFKRGWILGGNGHKVPAKPLPSTPSVETQETPLPPPKPPSESK